MTNEEHSYYEPRNELTCVSDKQGTDYKCDGFVKFMSFPNHVASIQLGAPLVTISIDDKTEMYKKSVSDKTRAVIKRDVRSANRHTCLSVTNKMFFDLIFLRRSFGMIPNRSTAGKSLTIIQKVIAMSAVANPTMMAMDSRIRTAPRFSFRTRK